jgi:hypothetical protein
VSSIAQICAVESVLITPAMPHIILIASEEWNLASSYTLQQVEHYNQTMARQYSLQKISMMKDVRTVEFERRVPRLTIFAQAKTMHESFAHTRFA